MKKIVVIQSRYKTQIETMQKCIREEAGILKEQNDKMLMERCKALGITVFYAQENACKFGKSVEEFLKLLESFNEPKLVSDCNVLKEYISIRDEKKVMSPKEYGIKLQKKRGKRR